MQDYKHKNKPLTGKVAADLILEFFDKQAAVPYRDIEEKVTEVHLSRGGLPQTSTIIGPTVRGLSRLKNNGKANNPTRGLWSIDSNGLKAELMVGDLKIELENFGVLKQAEFTLGDLTILCGKNNTGKTYATYALYGFLESWNTRIDFKVTDSQIQPLFTEGSIKIRLTEYVEKADRLLAQVSKRYVTQMLERRVFAATDGLFHNSKFRIKTGPIDVLNKEFERERRYTPRRVLIFSKKKGSDELIIRLVLEEDQEDQEEEDFNSFFIKTVINATIGTIIFSDYFPDAFISSAERTGASIFRRELDFARNRLLEQIGQGSQRISPRQLILDSYQTYPAPIEENVDFIRRLEDIAKRQSFIAKEHPEVLARFADIIGGRYVVTEGDQLSYIPKGANIALKMVESSSAVRSLLDIGFYLRHVAQKGDLLIVDEPELNLHPENQCRIARLFASLIKIGIKVFITTHSDYIVKELNTLIMLNHDKPHLKSIAKEYGYQDSELIRSDQVKVYMAQEKLMSLEKGRKKRKKGFTFVEAKVHHVLGIEASSFDETINRMNSIQEDIIWGAE